MQNFFTESAVTPDTSSWWNRPHVLTPVQKEKFDRDRANDDPTKTCERDRNCWQQAAKSKGNLSVLVADCAAIQPEACFLRRMANLSGLIVGCVSAKPEFAADGDAINTRLYDGQYNKFASAERNVNLREFLAAYDLHDSS